MPGRRRPWRRQRHPGTEQLRRRRGVQGGQGPAAPPNQGFANARQNTFRYGIITSPAATCGISGHAPDGDLVVYNRDGGTLFHELGHTMGLWHGGNENNNCKPNYVSTMNYDMQFGTPRVGGGAIIDFSPPRIAFDGSTAAAPHSAASLKTSSTRTCSSTQRTTATGSATSIAPARSARRR
jgi:hypothetical protein